MADLIQQLKVLVEPIRLSDALQLHQELDFLRLEYESGSQTALFRCLAAWSESGLPSNAAPDWAVEAICSVGADYGRAVVRAAEDQTPRPSLDEIAGMAGRQRSGTPWDQENRTGQAAAFRAAFDNLKEKATRGEAKEYLGVGILNARGEPTREFQIVLVRAFGMGGNSEDADYKTARRWRALKDI